MSSRLKQVSILIWWGMAVFSLGAKAAYRVYQLKVTPFDERNRPLKTQTVLSTLNQFEYESYQGYGKMRVVFLDSWYCPGDTSQHDYCPKPKDKRLQRGPAGLFAPKRKRP